jgi:hypothetical protein
MAARLNRRPSGERNPQDGHAYLVVCLVIG